MFTKENYDAMVAALTYYAERKNVRSDSEDVIREGYDGSYQTVTFFDRDIDYGCVAQVVLNDMGISFNENAMPLTYEKDRY